MIQQGRLWQKVNFVVLSLPLENIFWGYFKMRSNKINLMGKDRNRFGELKLFKNMFYSVTHGARVGVAYKIYYWYVDRISLRIIVMWFWLAFKNMLNIIEILEKSSTVNKCLVYILLLTPVVQGSNPDWPSKIPKQDFQRFWKRFL